MPRSPVDGVAQELLYVSTFGLKPSLIGAEAISRDSRLSRRFEKAFSRDDDAVGSDSKAQLQFCTV